MGTVGKFFAGVGALVRRPSDGRYLLLRRTEEKDFAAGAWECVTGRVDQGESFTDAVAREVREELGVSAGIDFILGTMHFYRGDVRPENELIGVLYCCSVEDPGGITLDWEHSEHRWVTAKEARELLPEGHWLARLIERAKGVRALLPPELVAYYREQSPEF
ncbi:MAG: NUDIX domain-containing protein [Anaerolineae bacterium]|jgi:8-oxo-dGTP pyrophosphatase MutT (NUDIX family)